MSEGNVVTGGYIYRGTSDPFLAGTYVFTDFGSREIWGLTPNQKGDWERSGAVAVKNNHSIASFGEDDDGELFAVDLVSGVLSQVAPG